MPACVPIHAPVRGTLHNLRLGHFGAPPFRARGFSLIELVIVVVIIGIVAAIAIPRMSRASANSTVSAIRANLRILTEASALYEGEHNGTPPWKKPDGSLVAAAVIESRLTGKTTAAGAAGGIYGPYLRAMPRNPVNKLATLRLDGVPAGANLAGWRLDSTTGTFQADDSLASAAITIGGPVAAGGGGGGGGGLGANVGGNQSLGAANANALGASLAGSDN